MNQSSIPFVRKKEWQVGDRMIINNQPTAASAEIATYVIPHSLPVLLSAWNAIERATGYAWRCTSYIRHSPSHKYGISIDLAPDMEDDLKRVYAHTHNSDPILHSRPTLLRKLLKLKDVRLSPWCDVIIATESDHLHVQLVPVGRFGPHPVNVVRWQTYKPLYKDTVQRNAITQPLRSGEITYS